MRNSETKEQPTFTATGELGDFTATSRLLPISAAAIVIGVIASFVALALLKLIGLFTNLFYFQRWSTDLVSPAGNHLGLLAVLVPVAGALIIGLMARYGSERIRGHGIPEAIESILLNGSRVQPKLAILKPLSSAISIGSGGPFGAEGPDHHDGRRIRVDDRAAISFEQYRAQDAAGGGSRGRYVGNLRGPAGGGPAGSRTAVVRMEAAQPDPGGTGERYGGRRAAIHHGSRPAVSGT